MKAPVVLACGIVVGVGSAWSFQKVTARADSSADLALKPTPTATGSAGSDRDTYRDPVNGFRLVVPRFPGSGPSEPKLAAQFSGTPDEGYASTAQVVIQPAKTTRDEYRSLSLRQFREGNLTVLADRDRTVSGRDAIEFEYEGLARGTKLRFLALAVIEPDRVVLLTCAARPGAFPAIEAEYRATLAGFRVGDGE